MQKPIERYILWLSSGQGNYTPSFYNTVEDALLAEKYTTDWYLTEVINSISAYGNYDAPKRDVTT